MSFLFYGQDTLDVDKLKNKEINYIVTSIKAEEKKLTSTSVEFIKAKYDVALKNKNYNGALIFLNKLSEYYIFKSLEHKKAKNLCNSFNKYLVKCNDFTEIARYYINYSEALTYTQKYKQSLNVLNDAIKILEKEQDSTLNEFGYAYLKAGENSSKINNISESAQYFKKAREIFLYQKDTLYYLWTQNGLGTLFSENGLYDEAEKERIPIYNLAQKSKAYDVLAIANLRAAIDNRLQENIDKEIYFANQALRSLKSKSDVSEIVVILTYSIASGTFSRTGNLKKSDSLLSILNEKMIKKEITPFLNTYYTRAQIYNEIEHKNYDGAQKLVNSIYSKIKETNQAQILMELERALATIEEKKGNDKQSLLHYKKYVSIKDSLNNSASKKKFAYVQSQFDVERKDFQISEQNKNIKLLSAESKLKSQWILVSIIGLTLLFMIAFLWRSYLFTKKKGILQKEYSQNLIKRSERERKRLAQELHDGIGQNLVLIKNQFLQTETKKDTSIIDVTIEEVRNLSQGLHPFQIEKLGLIEAVKYTIEQFQKSSTIFYSAKIETNATNLSKETEVYLFRMIQECLTNVEKHSQARACQVLLKKIDGDFLVQIKDNGKGFSVEQKMNKTDSLGMKTLKERSQLINSVLQIESNKDLGTVVKIVVPLENA